MAITQSIHRVSKWTIKSDTFGGSEWVKLRFESEDGDFELTLFPVDDDMSKLEPFIGNRQGVSIVPPVKE